MDDPRRLLTQISSLLDRYGLSERASFVARVRNLAGQDDFWSTLAGPEFWAGSGAVWEAQPFELSHPEVAEAAWDYRHFQTLMVELSDVLDSKGMSDLSPRTAALFPADK